jgi:hypothetical protein
MTERSWVQTPAEVTIFHAPFIWINSKDQKREIMEIMECSNLPGIFACAVILLMGGCGLRMVGL